MLLVVLIPLFFAMNDWSRRRLVCNRCTRMLNDLAEARHLARASVALPTPGAAGGIFAIAYLTTEQGLAIGSSFSQAAVWMRIVLGQAQKLGKLSAVWFFRLAALVLLVLIVRLYLVGDLLLVFTGMNWIDRLLIATGSGFLGLCSCLFLRLVPEIPFDADGILSEMAAWLRSRIAAENGEFAEGLIGIQDFGADELRSGLSRYEDKSDQLNGFWQTRLHRWETAGERALDLMPLAEFVGFGIFVLGLIGGPVLELGA